MENKRIVFSIVLIFTVVSGVFAERIWGSSLEFLKNARTDEEFAAAARDWDIIVGNSGWRTSNLSNDVFNAISQELSHWNKSVGNVFIFGCYAGGGGGYDVMLRINRVNNDGSFNYTWYAWRRDV